MDPRRSVTAAGLVIALSAFDVLAAPARPGTPSVQAPAPAGPPAILAANQTARAPSRPDRFTGGMQVFDYAPGRIYEVWTAPLRVTALSLSPGEAVLALAAGDTLRWQIAEVASGDGGDRQVHVLIKPLERGLETNLVLTTSARIYLIALRSGRPVASNVAVAWSPPPKPPPPTSSQAAPSAPPLTLAPLDAAYRLEFRGRRPPWAPVAVMSDGARTLIVFPPGLANLEAPALIALSDAGTAEMVNYRQVGDVFVADRVLQRAELRLGDTRRGRVRIVRAEPRR